MKNIICDIDGTIADPSHRLHFIRGEKKDWDSFHKAAINDVPIRPTCNVIRILADVRHCIWYITGRDNAYRAITLNWLAYHSMPIQDVLMRKHGDHRPDYIVKEEMAKASNFTPENTLCVFEDRNQTVRMWRDNGFTCYQVSDGDY